MIIGMMDVAPRPPRPKRSMVYEKMKKPTPWGKPTVEPTVKNGEL